MNSWRTFWKKFTHFRYFRRSVTMFALLLNVPVLCLGILGYINLMEQSTQTVKQRYEGALTDIVNTVDSRFSALATMTTQFSTLPWIKEYVYSKHRLTYEQLDQLELIDQIQELQIFNATNELLSGIILVLGDQQYVISSYGRNPFEKFFGEYFVLQEIGMADFQELLYEENFCRLVGPMQISNYQNDTEMILCVSSLPLRQKSVYANVLMVVNCNKLENLLSSSSLSQSGVLSIYTQDNQERIVGGEVTFPESSENLSYWEDAVKGTAYFSLSSEITGWKYIVALPRDLIHSAKNQITAFALAAMVLYLLLSVAAAFVLAFYRTRPLEKLIEHARSVNQQGLGKAEDFSYIEQTMLQMIQNIRWSSHQLDIYRPVIRNSVLQQLLIGQSPSVTSEQLEEVLAISFPYSYFVCAGFQTDKEYTDMQKIVDDLENQVSFAEGVFYLCNIRPRFKTVIINLTDIEVLPESICILKSFFIDHGLQIISVGVGSCKDTIEKLPESFSESEEALRYCWLNTPSSVVYYTDLNLHPKQYLQFPPVDHILGFLCEGNGQAAIEAAQTAIRQCTQEQVVPLLSLKHLYYFLICQGSVALQMKGLAEKTEEHILEILTSDTITLSQMQICLEQTYLSVSQSISGTEEKQHTPIQRVLEYIDGHYADRMLSLGQVAEHFHISPSYVSRTFKTATGYNFLDYLNKRRIDAAKKLLLEEETILAISLKSGFETDATFRRLFKKYTGMTPSRYKEIYGEKPETLGNPSKE